MSVARASEKNRTILLIDSDVEEYYKDLLASIRDRRIVVRATKEKAFEYFFNHEVGLVLLDHTPDAPCIELLQVVRFITPSVPVIIMTAYGSEDLAVTAFRNGASDYLTKPLDMDELKERIRAVLDKRDASPRDSINQNTNGIQKAIRYINAHYPLPLTVSRVAREAAMSVSRFERDFKKTLGVTFSIYLNKVRIARAMQMLEQGDGLSMSEIAFACGFTNQYHFCRMFKKLTKISPRDFKKSLITARR